MKYQDTTTKTAHSPIINQYHNYDGSATNKDNLEVEGRVVLVDDVDVRQRLRNNLQIRLAADQLPNRRERRQLQIIIRPAVLSAGK